MTYDPRDDDTRGLHYPRVGWDGPVHDGHETRDERCSVCAEEARRTSSTCCQCGRGCDGSLGEDLGAWCEGRDRADMAGKRVAA